jgi:DNA-binding NtrC family response regulator
VSEPNVLLVDDEREFLAALTEPLMDSGLNVLNATDGSEALHILKRIQIDVVLLDVFMPGRGGLQTLTEIRKGYPETSIILLTGLADVETAYTAMRGGAFDYLVKPVPIDTLLARIRDAHTRRLLKRDLQTAARRESERAEP